jgi:hypothetical protein
MTAPNWWIVHLLDQKAKGLADELQHLSLEQRRLLLASAVGFAGKNLADDDFAVRDIVSEVLKKRTLSEEQVREAKSLAEEADNHYFRLQEEGAPEAEWIRRFSQARLLTGIAAGFGGDDWTKTAHAMYELFSSLKDPSELIALVRSQIKDLHASNLGSS